MFHCLVIKVSVVSTAHLVYHIFSSLSRTFFKFFRSSFLMCCCRLFADDLFTLSCIQSFVNYFFLFSEKLLIFHISETIISDSSIRLPHKNPSVNTFLQFFTNTFLLHRKSRRSGFFIFPILPISITDTTLNKH